MMRQMTSKQRNYYKTETPKYLMAYSSLKWSSSIYIQWFWLARTSFHFRVPPKSIVFSFGEIKHGLDCLLKSSLPVPIPRRRDTDAENLHLYFSMWLLNRCLRYCNSSNMDCFGLNVSTKWMCGKELVPQRPQHCQAGPKGSILVMGFYSVGGWIKV